MPFRDGPHGPDGPDGQYGLDELDGPDGLNGLDVPNGPDGASRMDTGLERQMVWNRKVILAAGWAPACLRMKGIEIAANSFPFLTPYAPLSDNQENSTDMVLRTL